LGFEGKGLRNDGTDAARTEQAGQGNKEMDKKNNQIAHRRIVAGREILRKYGQNSNSPATGKTVGDYWGVASVATEIVSGLPAL
jgi:hypothetical protein